MNFMAKTITEPIGHLSLTLVEFWERADATKSIVDRLDLLREFAIRRVRRKRSAAQVRKKKVWVKKGAMCWACYMRKAVHNHHIVQVQHGGGTGPDCLVPLCKGCHAYVHPWLKDR